MSFNFTKEEFNQNLGRFGNGLLFKKIPSDVITPVSSALKIFDQFSNHHFLFESVQKGNNRSRFSVIGVMPDLVFKVKEKKSFINKNFANNDQDFQLQEGDVLENLRNLINESQINWNNLNYISEELPSICSGIFGFMSYDMGRFMENLPDKNLPDEINIPDSIFIRPQVIIIFDNSYDCALICAPTFSNEEGAYEVVEKKILEIEEILKNPKKENKKEVDFSFNFSSNYSKEEYCNAVEKAKEYIVQGDIFQVLPSQRFTSNFDRKIPEFSFYRSLRSINPSPFLFYLKFDDFVLTGSSPEIMVSLKDNKINIRPLAGTRKRGKNSLEDKEIAQGLLNDEKEVAEHLMLIDLGRHDVGMVAKSGSVEVMEKMVIENYSHVMHISSSVEGVLRDELDALDALIAGFPAGTVSGAPKIRAMEIIEEIEKIKRSFYSGCVGYFASNGDMETCITLRSALIKNGKIYLQAGAGVVYDSNPESEYQECINKAQALVRACENIKEFL